MSSSLALRAAVLGALLASSSAWALDGSATLAGRSALHVAGCGTHRASLSQTLVVGADGTWSAVSSDDQFSGTWTPLGRSGRKIRMALDAASTAALVASVAEEIGPLCEITGIVITATRAKVVTLKLDRRQTKAKLLVRYVIKGKADGRSGTAVYKVTASGPWTPGS